MPGRLREGPEGPQRGKEQVDVLERRWRSGVDRREVDRGSKHRRVKANSADGCKLNPGGEISQVRPRRAIDAWSEIRGRG